MTKPCSNPQCRLAEKHSGPCDTRIDDEVAFADTLAMPNGPEVKVLSRALVFARKMTDGPLKGRGMYALAQSVVWTLRNDGWELVKRDD